MSGAAPPGGLPTHVAPLGELLDRLRAERVQVVGGTGLAAFAHSTRSEGKKVEADLYEEAAREAARQVHDLEAVTAAQAMAALCFLHGAYAPRRPVGRRQDDKAASAARIRQPVSRPQLKIVKARAVTVTGSR